MHNTSKTNIFIFYLLVGYCFSSEIKILQISDIHYNNAFNIDYPNQWCQSSDLTPKTDLSHRYGIINCNPPIDLIDAVFEHSSKQAKYSAIVLSGDICSHELTDSLYRQCNEVLVKKLKQYFGTTPIIFAMGNNDTPTPKNITCSDQYYEFLYNKFVDYIPTNQKEQYLRNACYSQTVDGQLYIVINTNLLNPFQHNDCGVLDWLENQLSIAKASSLHPIIVGHIPPGVSSYDLKAQLKEEYQNRLFTIIKKYKSTINSLLLGHIHRDEFRLLPSEDPVVMLVAIGISPVYTNNPGYKIFSTTPNRAEGYIDSIQYTMNLNESNNQKFPVWFEPYSFISEYQVKDISISSLQQVKSLIFNDVMKGSLYRWRTVGLYDRNEVQIKCAITATSKEEMLQCTKSPTCVGLKY
ncbi:ser/thr protein phosphatase family protein [Entamoeba histolytica HM-1:IMSS-B]|uniref:Ser/thr protein phosphatase family protein n=6 Tax=Entamoeba histolytica TaxID=5759 RepID=C4M8T3_ENTH1|nr:ser/thr protein phosphatase family protein [Entamoeba histolytica HM-1:IMSS]EMD42687.1 sphingomyelin phosphodiesterase, putative [Entamoeba histolytica KU27]EMH74124.1 ser/thr protein phosphatase family protein [Entamoeba histolytica HM-1:IMSS-B]EMS14653.1 sphingomyelin phosphodiesterase, putative [Entamoeba histolytica HM-3:IMSS]ENY65223.1 sphingomyelin phosphodiesterase, putative [Entamoeba histolytica HM-1:IMSS-A]GAT98029.1 Ser Thr protein phosphatase family protein [Entamoeba histolytic|eukprot:XP_649711.1 ser/thr protein phosphatase family protein [Entamoeba histolytica HM-1:IMSS]